MKPIVLVASQGDRDPKDIIKTILKINGATMENVEEVTSETNEKFLTHLCNLKTKYYENTIALLPFAARNIAKLPADVLKASEMLIIYFEPHNKSFQEQVPVLSKFLEVNDIELGILLTTKLYDNADLGLTYEGLKTQATFQFDIIELSDEERVDDEQQAGYKEVLEALKNHLWSNINKPTSECNSEEVENLEEELENFEELLTSIQNFKSASRNMERSNVIDEAERLAELFVKILHQD